MADVFVTLSLDAHRAHHFQISHAHQGFFHAVHLERAHAAAHGAGQAGSF